MDGNAMAESGLIQERYERIVCDWRRLGIRNREQLASVLADYRVYFAYNSGKIENVNITYNETREVLENGRVVGYTGDVRTLFEIQNQKECHELLLDAYAANRLLDEALVLEAHRTLTQGTYDERRWSRGERPGCYKLHDYVVGVSQVGSAPDAVAEDVAGLLDELAATTRDNVLTVAAYYHAAFEAIHPFADGNGRVGRALSNYLLVSYDHPPIIVFEEDRMAYYGAMQVWDEEGDLDPMLDLLRAEAVKTWRKGL